MAITFDHVLKRIPITPLQTSLTIQDLVNAIRTEEATAVGIADDQILSASGKEVLDVGVAVGITAMLMGIWQIEWWPGNYTAKIGGGNIVAAVGDPVAYVVNGPQVEITLSAAATIVSEGGSIPTPEEVATAVLAAADIDPIASNVKQVNDITVTGTGQVGDEWGPV